MAVGVVVLMRVASTAVLVRAMVPQVGMLHQRALLARRGLMRRDSYLQLITMLLAGGVAVAAVVREGTEGAVPSGYSLSIMEVGDLWWIVALLQVVEEREVMGVRAEPMVAEPVVVVVAMPSRMPVEAGRVVRVRLEALVGGVVVA